MRWIDPLKETTALNLEELNKAADHRTFARLLIHRVTMRQM